MFDILGTGVCILMISFILRQIVTTIIPFDMLFVVFPSVVLRIILFKKMKFIGVKDERTGHTTKWDISAWFRPKSHRFSLKAIAAAKWTSQTAYVDFCFYMSQSFF